MINNVPWKDNDILHCLQQGKLTRTKSWHSNEAVLLSTDRKKLQFAGYMMEKITKLSKAAVPSTHTWK